jgi:hypothetical protein
MQFLFNKILVYFYLSIYEKFTGYHFAFKNASEYAFKKNAFLNAFLNSF